MTTLPPLADELPTELVQILNASTALETTHEGRRTVWHVWGDADGVPLLLLHGGSGSWAHWCRNVQALAATGRKVYVPDIPGFGDSEPPVNGSDAGDVIAPIQVGMRDIAGDAPWDVVGFSFGGMVATLLTQASPQSVRRLILVAPGGLGIRSTRLDLQSPRGVTDPVELENISRGNLSALMLHRKESITSAALQIHHANVRRDRMMQRRLAMTDIVTKALPALHCPIDVIVGSHDQIYRELPDAFDAVFNGLEGLGEIIRIPDAGHWVQYEAADLFNVHLKRLLAGGRLAD